MDWRRPGDRAYQQSEEIHDGRQTAFNHLPARERASPAGAYVHPRFGFRQHGARVVRRAPSRLDGLSTVSVARGRTGYGHGPGRRGEVGLARLR